jgi:CheY-like chemotaxis protein
MMLAEYLREIGYSVMEAVNAGEAVAMLQDAMITTFGCRVGRLDGLARLNQGRRR